MLNVVKKIMSSLPVLKYTPCEQQVRHIMRGKAPVRIMGLGKGMSTENIER